LQFVHVNFGGERSVIFDDEALFMAALPALAAA
jgi:hypothetical protein